MRKLGQLGPSSDAVVDDVRLTEPSCGRYDIEGLVGQVLERRLTGSS